MLKPKKKITKKEIKRDPLLETTFKAQTYLKKNRASVTRIAIGVAVVVIIAYVLIGQNRTRNTEARTAFGKALVAYASNDLDNARLQFEFVSDEYSGKKQGAMADYYLGKILYDQNDFSAAKLALEDYIKSSQVELLTSNAFIMLSDIYVGEGDLQTSIKMVKNAIKSASNVSAKASQQIILAELLLGNDQATESMKIVDQLLTDDTIPTLVKNQAEQLAGKLLALVPSQTFK